MDTIFTVKNEDLERLNPQEAIDFFRELLWAEARRIGIQIDKIRVSSRINVPDGGVDAVVERSDTLTQNGIIKLGHTSYQIKAGETFKPWDDAQIKKELFGNRNPSKENLGSSVRNCLDNDGTYVLVCFKQDPTEEQYSKAVENLRKYFEQCRYQKPKVEVWGQNNLIGFLTVFPSLALKLNRRGGLQFQTHQSWAQDAEMRREFKAGQAQRDFISNMQSELRKDIEAVHIRVLGKPDIGKTRLVLEATRAEDLQPLVIYCDAASKFRDSDLMNEILRDDNKFNLILIIDECDSDSRSYIWNKLKYKGPRIKLISIYNELDETSGNINYLNAPPLENEQISSIIQEYGNPKDQVDRWVEFCRCSPNSGSPMVAHVFGQNLKNNPDDLFRPPDTVNVWDRYLAGGDDPNIFQERKLILQYVALFKRFGYRKPFINEAQAIAKMIERANPQITWSRFQEIIQDLKHKILHGDNTLHITPKALHIKLWIDWWDNYGRGFSLDEFLKDLPKSLHEWFFEMFKYASSSKSASEIVKELLGENGPFKNGDYLKTKLGARFFLALTEADPKSALERLKATIGTWSKEELLQFTTGRREIIWALEMIAIWRDLFADAARLLLALGEAENEPWSNNASGVFAGLLSFGPGKLAPTEASPQERFPILKEALESVSKERRTLSLNACDVALTTHCFSRIVGAEYQGLRQEPQLWMPKTYEELFDAYRQVWQLLCERLDSLQEDERQRVIDILLQHSIDMIHNLPSMVIDTIEELSKKPYVDKKKVLAEIIKILHYDSKNLPVQIRQRCEQLRDNLTGHDFSSLMKRYVGMDLFVDKLNEKGEYVDQTQPQVEKLAQQAVDNVNLLRRELDWLVTTETQNGYRFGYELGKRDKDFLLLPILLEAQRKVKENASVYFLRGYFRALFEKDQTKWEEHLDILVEDKKLNLWIPELSLQSEMSDQAALRILRIAEIGIISIGHFKMFCSVILNLSEDIFKKWIDFLHVVQILTLSLLH